MISRYTRPEMGRIWAEENKFRMWLAVEVAATETLAEAGLVPEEAAKAIHDKGDFNLARIHQIEAEVKHDVIAFTTAVAEKVGPQSRWLHYGLTSNDVVDTAQALQLKEASELILKDLKALRAVLKRRAFEFKDTPMIGRTHGIHAEPITFGLKLANWYSETERNIARFERAADEMRVGKLSGAVGTFAHLEPEYEVQICERLGLKAAEISSQVIQRDRHATYISTLAVITATLDMIATEIRHLQRTEVREAEEFFSEKQKGSSAMPHKRNPLTFVGRARDPAGFDHPDRLLAEQDDETARHPTGLSETHVAQPGEHGRAGVQRSTALGPSRKRNASRGCLPSSAGACHARLEARVELPRTGDEGQKDLETRFFAATQPRFQFETTIA